MAILHVLTAGVQTADQADALLRAARRALPRKADGRCVLLLCDLADASALRMPEDDSLIRRLQSGVMSMERLRPGEVLLLVRRRAWDPANQLYLGQDQAMSPREVLAQLLADGKTDAVFEAASFTPASLRGRFDHILIADAALSCTPDTPQRMAMLLQCNDCSCVKASVRCMPQDNAPLLVCLLHQGFSLLPAEPGFPLPALYTAEALAADAAGIPAEGCVFALHDAPTVRGLLQQLRAAAMRGPVLAALLPTLQTAMLLLSALLGSPLLALAALILPERAALRHLSRILGAWVRSAVLPLRAAVTLDALLGRLFAQRRLRPALPRVLQGNTACVGLGVTLLALALSSVHALPILLPLALLWICAPLILRALEMPAAERIPLTEDEMLLLRGDAQSLLFAEDGDTDDAGLSMLCACAGCMLGLLEPDEAARRIEHRVTFLDTQLQTGCWSLSRAAALASAQFLREHMAKCDAALRELPAQLEARVLCSPPPDESSLLARLIRAAIQESSAPLYEASSRQDAAADSLFLPLALLTPAESAPATLPLTHPHTYAKRRALPDMHEKALPEAGNAQHPLLHALCLASSALGHPFRALLLRSPVIAPAAAGLAVC